MRAKPGPNVISEIVRGFADQETFPLGEIGRASRKAVGGDSADQQDVDEVMAEVVALARRERGLKDPSPPLVALVRKQRHKGDDWFAQRTWLGGLPTLGGGDWPRGGSGRPLHHIARIDLAEVHSAAPGLPLADRGTLSFFFSETDDGSEGAVRFTPPGEDVKTSPPADLPPAYQEDGYAFPSESGLHKRDCFPYWPLEAIRLDLPSTLPTPSLDYKTNQLIWDAQMAALHAHFPERQSDFGVQAAHKLGIDGAGKVWWHGAILMREKLAIGISRLHDVCRSSEASLARSRQYLAGLDKLKPNYEKDVARCEQQIVRQEANFAGLQRTATEVRLFSDNFGSFVSGHDPWDELDEAEIGRLEEFRLRLHKEFRQAYSGNPPYSLDSIRNVSVERLMIESDKRFAKLPDDLVTFINDHYRTPTRNFHQLFGFGADVQEAPYRHLGDHLLLQIAYDSIAQMKFGDVGAVQFWIAPRDLEAQRWDKVQMTFEGH